uniref:phospholipase A2 n=1 Tax=Gasterosteus aculeatus TaxID=69293 RepID=G3PBF6_GASAC
MRRQCTLQVFFVLSLHVLSKAHYVIGSGPSCLRSSPAGLGQTRVTFLREDATGVRSLYVSLWSEDARPVTCQVNTNPTVTDRYFSVCNRSGGQGREIRRKFNTSILLSPGSPCKLASSGVPEFIFKRARRDATEGKVVRRKRAWIFPGTLWCGTGSKADEYEQLGMFESADRCCREHDHCLHVIPAFTGNYGVFNSNFFTVSHCDCDQRFRECLLGVNDSISSMVGYSFFNILRVPCFDLTQQRRCTEWYWWGMCKVAEMAPCAVFRSPLPYADVTGDTFQPRCKSCLEQKATSGMTTVTQSKTMYVVPVKMSTNSTRILKRTETPQQDDPKTLWNTAASATSVHNENSAIASNAATSPSDHQLLCGSLKHLDECKYSIIPLGNKYNLQNMKSKTAYHCDCTSRIVQLVAVLIKSFKQPSILPKLLMDFVSQSCFNLPNEKKCHRRKSCSGGFSKASDLLQALSMMEERDTTGVQNSANERKRGIPTRLYKRCLRLTAKYWSPRLQLLTLK